jgi:ATP-dependent RNA helicase DDX46/PRP5
MRCAEEIEINDYPQQARWKVTHKDALASITEFTGCGVTAKGQFYPPGRNPPVGQRKLFLFIEGNSYEVSDFCPNGFSFCFLFRFCFLVLRDR